METESPRAAEPVTGRQHAQFLLQFFTYAHLPIHLQAISRPFTELAEFLEARLPNNPEKTMALRKLLEAKDCAVRAALVQ